MIIGLIIYFFIHLLIRKKPFLYILGHELTHVLFIWISNGWAYRLRIKKNSGSVCASKDNIFISLSPYFFPLYTFICMFVYLFFISITRKVLIFSLIQTIIGITAGFHFLFTAEMLLTKQDDFKDIGRFLSASIILCLNIIFFSVFFVLISKHINAEIYFTFLKNSTVYCLQNLLLSAKIL